MYTTLSLMQVPYAATNLSKYIPVIIMSWRHHCIKTFHITGPLWGESTSHWWIPLTKGQWCRAVIMFPLSLAREQSVEQTVQLPVIINASMLMWSHCDGCFPTQRVSNAKGSNVVNVTMSWRHHKSRHFRCCRKSFHSHALMLEMWKLLPCLDAILSWLNFRCCW